MARVRFALLAAPEIRTRCGTPPSKRPLPPLTQDPALPVEDDVAIGLVGPLANALTGLRDLAPFETGSGRTRIADARGRATKEGVAIVADLRGEVCGPVEQRSPIVWQPDGSTLSFSSPVVAPTSLDATKVASAFGGARLPPPIAPANLKELLPGLGSALSDPSLDVTVKIGSVTPLDAHVREDDLIARVKLRGSVELREK